MTKIEPGIFRIPARIMYVAEKGITNPERKIYFSLSHWERAGVRV